MEPVMAILRNRCRCDELGVVRLHKTGEEGKGLLEEVGYGASDGNIKK